MTKAAPQKEGRRPAQGTGPSASRGPNNHRGQDNTDAPSNATTPPPPPASPAPAVVDPAAGQAAFEIFLQHLPPVLQERFRKYQTQQITDLLSIAGSDPALEALLPPLRFTDAGELLNRTFEPLKFIVPNYLPVGLAFLAGKPKVGKSWLAMQLARAKLDGSQVMGGDITKGRVLYLALEDNERRFNDRMLKQGWPDVRGKVDIMWYQDFHQQIGSLNSGGGKRLMKHLETNRYDLLVVDTMSRSISADQLDVREMTGALGEMQHTALKLNVCILIIDHLRKGDGKNPDSVNDLFGSVAKGGVADTLWTMYKEQGKRGAKLEVTGKDVDTKTLKLDFDKASWSWNFEGEAHEVENTERREELIGVFANRINLNEGKGVIELSAKEIADEVGQDLANTRKRLNDLCNAGLLKARSDPRGSVFYSKPEG